MTVVTLRPNGTVVNTGTVTGAANAHTALSDDTDASYVGLAGAQQVTVNFADLTLPGGAVITAASVRARVVKAGTATASLKTVNLAAQGNTVNITWTTPTTIVALVLDGPPGDAAIDGEQITCTREGFDAVAIYAEYLDVTYVAVPVVDVTAPATPVNNTNLPAVAWTNTLDSDGGDQTRYEAKVFTAAQYGAGGFSPDTSTPFETSGQVASAAQSWTPGTIQPDGTYRAYVRVAQTVNGSAHWSAWDYIQYTVAVALPGVPSIVATADDDDASIEIDLDDTAGSATTDLFEVHRSLDGGTTWEPLRTLLDGGLVAPVGGVATMWDYEAPNGTTVAYRARGLHDYSGVYAASAWASDSDEWASGDWWLKHPQRPDLNMVVEIDGQSDRKRAARHGVFQALGAALPVVVADTRGGATGTVRLRVDTAAQRAALDALLDETATLLLQGPPADGLADRYVRVGDHDRARIVDKAFVVPTFDTLPWIEVAYPAGNIAGWPYDQEVLSDNPSLYWPNLTQTAALDTSGNSRHGTINGAPAATVASPVTNDTGTGLDLDGTNDYIASGYSPFVNGATRTFEGWAWRDTTATYHVLFGSDTAVANDKAGLYCYSGNQDVLFRSLDSSGSFGTWTAAWPGVAQWVHWALVFNETSNVAELFINGVSKGTQTITAAYHASPGNFEAGARGGSNLPWDGRIAKVAVYETGLSAGRIAAHASLRRS